MGKTEAVRRGSVYERILLAAGLICLLLSALPMRQTVWFLLSAAAHELGHIAVMRLCSMPLRGIASTAGGMVLRWESESVPYRKELFCACAGPFVNAVLAVCMYKTDAVGFAVNVLLAGYNLLPLRGNDGAVILTVLSDMCGNGIGMRRRLGILGDALSAVLLMLGAWVFWYGAMHDAAGQSLAYGTLFFCMLFRLIGEFEVDTCRT